jgi:DNA repair protein RecN (Recombination protein N)
MLSRVYVKNFALIQELDWPLNDGFTVITGETGSGKSILLGALSLALGDRAEAGLQRSPEAKTVVELTFTHVGQAVKDLLVQMDADDADPLIIRRELLPAGRSRAFVNDTPVQLTQLRELGDLLIDIHGQMQNQRLNDRRFRFDLLDGFAGILPQRTEYQKVFTQWKATEKELHQLRAESDRISAERELNQSLLEELERVDLHRDESELEEELRVLENATGLKESLVQASEILDGDSGLLQLSARVKHLLDAFTEVPSVAALNERVQSQELEWRDLCREIQVFADRIEFDPERFERVRQEYDTIQLLKRKHGVTDLKALQEKKEHLGNRVFQADHLQDELIRLDELTRELSEQAHAGAVELHKLRNEASARISASVNELLAGMAMPNARFVLQVEERSIPDAFGLTEPGMLFSANAGMEPGLVEKTASGGERSRLMLSLKAVKSRNLKLPTLILDEIDSGVSGEVALRMARVMRGMAGDMQLVAITHLPQIAVSGAHHFKVLKTGTDSTTETRIIPLHDRERIHEIATMLSGDPPTSGALQNATELLNV